MRTRYPGVTWYKDRRKWRVRFRHKGDRYDVGCYEGEEEAARAHDDFVRANGLDRPLHFPAGQRGLERIPPRETAAGVRVVRITAEVPRALSKVQDGTLRSGQHFPTLLWVCCCCC